MAVVSVAYTAPVQVWVDTTEKKVVKVVVIDEDIDQNREGFFEVVQAEEGETTSWAEGYEIAEAEDWPVWEHGM